MILQDATYNYTDVVSIAKARRFPDSLATLEVVQVAPYQEICVLMHVGRSEDEGKGLKEPLARYVAEESHKQPQFVGELPKRSAKVKKTIALELEYGIFCLPDKTAIIERHIRGLDDYDVRIIICDEDVSFGEAISIAALISATGREQQEQVRSFQS